MIRRNHPSREAAIRAAVEAGYWPVHRRDSLYVLSDGKQHLAIQRETRARSEVFHLVPAPDCTIDWVMP